MIYVVEDEKSIQQLVQYTLKTAGFDSQTFSDGETFWQAMEKRLPDCVILDVMLPGKWTGLTILERMKQHYASVPVIIASALGSEFDRIHALDAGADDYLVKPYSMLELVSRIKAVLRRVKSHALFQVGKLSIDLEKHEVMVDHECINLTPKEFSLLAILYENAGRVIDRETLLSRLWGMDFEAQTRTLDVHIGALRTKLKDEGKRIVTVRSVGYRFDD